MKKNICLLTLFLLFSLVQVKAQILNLNDINQGKYSSKGVPEIVSSADGEFYYQANSAKNQIIKYSYKTGEAVETVFDAQKARDCTFEKFEGFIISPDEKRLLLYNDIESVYRHSFKANYFYYDLRRNMVRPLTQNKSKQMVPVFSHDGRMLAFVVDNNIWLAKFDYESESQITQDGQFGKIINGATDWVYEEEFGTTCLMDFSADNRLLAFVRFDETQVPEYSFQIYGNKNYPTLFSFKYPKTGEKNSKISCNVFDIDAKTIRKMNIPEDNTEYIPRIQFLPSGDELAVMTLNREQNQFNMYFANARSTVSRLILHEENARYIDSDLLNTIHFLGDQFTYVSEKSGYSHIYLYSNVGVEKKALTSGNYDVTDLLAVDPVTKTVFYESAEEGALYRSIYKVDINKGIKTKLSTQLGTNNASFSKNGKYYINRYSNSTTPSISTMHDASGKQLRVLEDNAALRQSLAKLHLPVKEFVTVKAQDGTVLNAYMLKPADFDPSHKYPLVMVQYSGPNSQEVRDRFELDWTSYLVNQGFIVACVDGRGTGARGEEFRKCTYMNLGIIESDDQIAAAHSFATLPYIDSAKIGIWGWSYGGYNVLMSMSRGNIFKAGVAIAPVTDWRFYDTVYGERYMRTPQQNAQGYQNGSAIRLANNLQGNLLLIHGSADDNVHFQNTMEYTAALIKANKQFDLFVFPDKNHSILGASTRTYLYDKVIHHFQNNM